MPDERAVRFRVSQRDVKLPGPPQNYQDMSYRRVIQIPDGGGVYGQRLLNRKYIRILTLQDENFSRELRCIMHEVQFESFQYEWRNSEDSQSYDAVSYVWGLQEDSRLIYCNNQEVNIPRNLRSALRQIWQKNPRIKIWADALCINQSDVDEKTHQVGMMGSIFETARCVHVWLGDPTGHTKWTLRYIKRCVDQGTSAESPAPGVFRRTVQQQLVTEDGAADESAPLLMSTWLRPRLSRFWRTLRTSWDQASANLRRPKNPSISIFMAFCNVLRVLHMLIRPLLPNWFYYYLAATSTRLAFHFSSSPCPASIQTGLRDLTARPWFYRAWTMQEILLAKHAVLRCGHYELEWSVWVKGLEQLLGLKGILDSYTTYRLEHAIIDMDMGTQTLSHLLVRSWARVATDPRDKLFSLLSLTEDREKISDLAPDYRYNIRQAYIMAARACIIDDSDLAILGAAGLTKSPYVANKTSRQSLAASWKYKQWKYDPTALPSWVPNWNDPNAQPQTFSPSNLARPWISDDSTNMFGQRLDDLSDFLVLRGVAIGRLRRTLADSGREDDVILLDTLPSCSFQKPSTASVSRTSTSPISNRRSDVTIRALVAATRKHDRGDCPFSQNGSSTRACEEEDKALYLNQASFPESTREGDWLSCMEGAHFLYVLRPLPLAASAPAEPDRRAHGRRTSDEEPYSNDAKFVLVGEMHPMKIDGDAVVLQHRFRPGLANSSDDGCICHLCAGWKKVAERSGGKNGLSRLFESCTEGQFVLC